MKRSIFFKMFSGYVFITIILSCLILAFSFTKVREFYIDSTVKDLQNLGAALETSAVPLVLAKNYSELDSLVKRMGKKVSTRITVIAVDGRVLADSETDPAGMANHRTRTEVALALEGKTGRFLRLSDTLKEEMLYVALPMKSHDATVAVLRLSLFLKEMTQATRHFRVNILLITLAILCLSLLVAFFFSRGLSLPIRELSEAHKRAAAKDFNVRVFLKNQDELKDLADSFNSMTAETRALISELTHQKEELASIITSLQEGLLVLNRDDRILLSNESFRKAISASSPIDGKFYWEIFREPRFDELIKQVRHDRQNHVEEIEFDSRVLLCGATFLKSEEEIAVVFHDITQIKNLERIKTDFVLNVSHELKTPLTAIKGFAETLEDVAGDEEARHYISIIRRNTDRLINIINDLLSLSQLEAKGFSPHFAEVDLVELAQSTMKIFESRIREKDLHLTLTTEGEVSPVPADPFRLEQMFINLIDNAVKYSEKGTIHIVLKKDESTVTITVRDTGIGIPREHLSRIFERFYVVDKSRSKKMCGTGLGLSIVKHVVLLHKGTIDVESLTGKGTTFTITLPAHLV
jgi:two-component system, OmpR family, phosphate regulon sensor histidine kinase PhoR